MKKSVKLFDAGGLIILWMLFGLPLGVIFDYLWNLLVFSVALPHLPGIKDNSRDVKSPGKLKRTAFIFFVTLLGILIDWAYVELIWDIGLGKNQIWSPTMSQPLQIAAILIPIIMLWAVDFALAYAYLRLEKKPSLVLGGLMAVFTAPWLLPTIPYLLGWVA